MATWSFTVYVSGVPNDLLEWSDAIYEAGCDDSSPGVSAGVAHVHFDREAGSLSLAVQSAVRQVQSCDYTVDRIELAPQEAVLWTA